MVTAVHSVTLHAPKTKWIKSFSKKKKNQIHEFKINVHRFRGEYVRTDFDLRVNGVASSLHEFLKLSDRLSQLEDQIEFNEIIGRVR